MQNKPHRETIWVVDDSATDAERVAQTLRETFDVKIFSDGPAALEKLASSPPPDLILLDWVMPGMSGVEVCSYIRKARPPVCDLPVILLTSQHRPEEINQAFQSGANDYIVKPFVDEELKARVRTLTSSRRHLRRAQNLVAALQKSEERLLLATNSGGIGIYEWDIQTGALTSSDIHRKIFELPAQGPVKYDDLFEKISPEDRLRLQANQNLAIKENSDYSSEFRFQRSNGETAWISGRGRIIYDDAGTPVRMVGIHVDITSQKASEDELKRAKDEAERANQMKSAFLANMSHEIRTPLGAMIGFANLMQDPTITAMELSQYLEVLTRNGEQLSVIINDILDLSKVEAGLLAHERREFSPAEIGRDVASSFAEKARKQNLTVEFIEDPSTPTYAVTDPTRVRQILMNLVGNSLKFTRAGGIKIRSHGTKHPDGKSCLLFDVEDTGIGVPAEHTERIFDVFVQGDESITRKFGGTGIGLALSRQLARELGGDLVLKSTEIGVGSVFQASVKNFAAEATAERPAEEIAKPVAQPISLDGVRVLVVDDAPDNRHLLSRYLVKRGAVVEVAENGLEGYQKALKHPYDVVLMDLQMPLMDGYTATKKLRSEGYQKSIIALTAHAMSEISAKCIEAGCNGYLPKPIDPNALFETISSYSK